MTVSTFDHFKIGIGPSSSRTMGPITAFDPLPPTQASGICVSLPAETTRGFGSDEFAKFGHLIADVIDGVPVGGADGNGESEVGVRDEGRALRARFPICMDFAGACHHGL